MIWNGDCEWDATCGREAVTQKLLPGRGLVRCCRKHARAVLAASATGDGPQAVAPKDDCARCVALTDALRAATCRCVNCGYRAALDKHDRVLASSVKQEKGEELGGDSESRPSAGGSE